MLAKAIQYFINVVEIVIITSVLIIIYKPFLEFLNNYKIKNLNQPHLIKSI